MTDTKMPKPEMPQDDTSKSDVRVDFINDLKVVVDEHRSLPALDLLAAMSEVVGVLLAQVGDAFPRDDAMEIVRTYMEVGERRESEAARP